ncbi:hypothetical protein AOCH_005383 [Aspergillus ochraceoroseus]|uniref:HNH nuclease domain-containing protein n=1 Tax=Aspergillus ochraceoroseus TaxID=138278 RepID=A0A0F8UQU6_9EURO|nr:hypothetical protein AOCH_005383 [Aspergillus ochraceoroseus]
MGPEGTEVPQNLLCLSTIVHDLWGLARLAFEPVETSDDKTSLTMRFWWLPLRTFSIQAYPIQYVIEWYHGFCDTDDEGNNIWDECVRVPPSLPADLKASPRNTKFLDCETDEPIYSGQLVAMTIGDPEAMPLLDMYNVFQF